MPPRPRSRRFRVRRLRSQTSRIYPLGKQAAHITGYVTRVSAEDIDSDPTGELAGIDWIGRAGIEAGANDLLTGRPGGRLMVVDCDSRAERTEIASRRPEEPKDVVLTIDKDFQVQVDDGPGRCHRQRGHHRSPQRAASSRWPATPPTIRTGSCRA